MASGDFKKLIVLDPALIAAGGHHTGFALTAAGSLSHREEPIELEFVCSHCIDPSLMTDLEEYGCTLRPDFFFNFYEVFEQSLSLTDCQAYIRQAAREYSRVILQLEIEYAEHEIVFFHPSLSWEHAFALSLALRSIGNMNRSIHIACAMFNPGIKQNGSTLNSKSKLYFGVAFRALQNIPNVKLFASDYELAEKYGHLLQSSEALPIHPCYLTDWQAFSSAKLLGNKGEITKSRDRIILYMGDAKRDKGFVDLPKLTRNTLRQINRRQEVYIQFSIPWADAELESVAEELAEIARHDNSLVVERKFLSEMEIHERLLTASLFVFNYSSEKYREKSSGFLWVVAWHKVPIYCFGRSWLSREAARLDLPVMGVSGELDRFYEVLRSLKPDAKDSIKSSNDYSRKIYSDYFTWVSRLMASG